jgi:hypothetical protein
MMGEPVKFSPPKGFNSSPIYCGLSNYTLTVIGI